MNQIYTVCGTWDICIGKGSYFTYYATIGYHRDTVIWILSHLIFGKDTPKIPPPKSISLTGDHPEGINNYIRLLKYYEG